jgi:hypothetical protein
MGATRNSDALTRAEAVRLAERHVSAYNDREVEAMLVLQMPRRIG